MRVLVACAVCALVACNTREDSTAPSPIPVGLHASAQSLSLIAGAGAKVTARAVYVDGSMSDATSVEWSSADPTVAIVGPSDGAVTALRAGFTTVTASAGSFRANIALSVERLDGSFAFTRMSRNNTLVTSDVLNYSATDRSVRPLPRPGPMMQIGGASWSADGTVLALEGISSFSVGEWIDYYSDVFVLNASAATSGASWRAVTATGLSKLPSLSPDGTRIAWLQQTALFSMNHVMVAAVNGGVPVRLTQMPGWYGTPQWSPDGTRLAFMDDFVGNGEIFVVNADGRALTNISQSPGTFEGDPSWSPDGSRLAFISSRDSFGPRWLLAVYVSATDGSQVKRLTTPTFAVTTPAWSPSGQQIVFSAENALFVMRSDGSALGRITSPPGTSWDRSPVWRH